MFDIQPIFCHNTHCLKSSIPYVSQRRNHSDIPHGKRLIFEKSKINELKLTDSNPSSLLMKHDNHIRHIASQTIYREESTQTDPFSPVYTISGGEHPEVFALSDFTYGKGLPATSVEISFIERLRARREWEHDHTIDITRTKIVIERELREWQLREKEIQMLETARHKLFTINLHHYIQADEHLTQSLIDLAISRENKQLKLHSQRLQIKASRDIRRIQRTYRLRHRQINAMTSYSYLGVIGGEKNTNGCVRVLKPSWHTRSEDFKNRFSKMSSVCPTFDYFIDRRMKQSGMDIFQLEKLIPKTTPMNRLTSLENSRNKKLQRRSRDLQRASQLIDKSSIEKKPLRFLEKIETIDHIQPLPTTPIQTEIHDQRRQTLIQFQNYLRCITVQSRIGHVYEIRQDLLDELRRELHPHQNSIQRFQSISTDPSDHLISDMLDFLSKELLRLQCEQSIHLFIILADRSRHQREAAETGSRTRAIEDEILQEIFSLDTNCDIESYLQDLILHSIDKTADDQARLEIQQITETLIKQTDLSSSSDPATLVSDLVHNYLIPTVSKLVIHGKTKVM